MSMEKKAGDSGDILLTKLKMFFPLYFSLSVISLDAYLDILYPHNVTRKNKGELHLTLIQKV